MSAEVPPGRVENLQYFLKEFEIPIGEWGQRTGKSLRDLALEEETGETTFHIEGGKLFRKLYVASIGVYCIEGSDIYMLHEDRQVFANGTVRKRMLPGSISEKIKAGELPEQAAARGLKEELGFTDPAISQADIHFIGNRLEQRESNSYKGLHTRTRLFLYDAVIDPTNPSFRDSYEEVQPDKTTHFVWRRI